MAREDRAQAEWLDAYWDAVVSGYDADEHQREPELAAVVQSLHRINARTTPDPDFVDRLWRELADGSTVVQQLPTLAVSTWRPSFAVKLQPLRWLAPAITMLVALVLLGVAFGTSRSVQAQIRRVGCMIPVFGIQDCDASVLAATQTTSITDGDLTVSTIYLVSTGKQTSLRLQISGLIADTSNGQSAINRPQLTSAQINELEATQVELRTDSGQTLTSRPSPEPARPDSPPGTPRYAVLQALHAIDNTPETRLTVEANWTFVALDPRVRAVDLRAAGPGHVWQLHVFVIPLQQAGLPSATGSGPAVTHDGVSLWVNGASRQADGSLVVEVGAHADAATARVVDIGEFDPDSGTFTRAMWSADGSLYLDNNRRCCPLAQRTEGDIYYQDLTFVGVPDASQLQLLEVPFVLVRQDLAPATLTVQVDGHAFGERIPLNANLVIGRDTLTVVAATLEESATNAQGSRQRSLLLEFDFGDWPQGRRLGLPLTISIDGHAVDPRTMQTVARSSSGIGISRYITERLPLPTEVGSQVTLTIGSPGVTRRGPWMLPMPGASSP